jgi:(+)-pinoresinol hydroxylase
MSRLRAAATSLAAGAKSGTAALAATVFVATALTGTALAADSAPAPSWTTATVTAPPGAPQGYVPFQKYCAVCHGTGFGKPGTRALAAKYKGAQPAALEERTDLSADFIKYTVRHGVSVMPMFRKTEISDAELDAIAAYLTRKR